MSPDADPYRYVGNDPVDLVDPTGLYATILGKYAAGLSGADVRGYSGFSDPLVNFGSGGGHSLIEEGPVLQRSEDLGFGGSSVSTVLQMGSGGSAYNGVSAELGLGSSSLSGGSGVLASSSAGMVSHEDQVMFEEANRQTRAQMGELVEPDTFATQGMGPRMGVASMGLAGIRSSPQPADANDVKAIAEGAYERWKYLIDPSPIVQTIVGVAQTVGGLAARGFSLQRPTYPLESVMIQARM